MSVLPNAEAQTPRFGGFAVGGGTELRFEPGTALPDRTLTILSGWAGRQRLLPDGRRQILKLDLAGDICGVFAGSRTADPPVALTHLRAVPTTPAENLGPVLEFEEWCVFNQLLRLGAMRATERMSHLLLEIYHRLALAKLAQDHWFDLHLTQEQLSDVLGLSAVHINRTLQTLRREGLIECRGVRVRLAKPDDLARTAHFVLPDGLRRPD